MVVIEILIYLSIYVCVYTLLKYYSYVYLLCKDILIKYYTNKSYNYYRSLYNNTFSLNIINRPSSNTHNKAMCFYFNIIPLSFPIIIQQHVEDHAIISTVLH